MGDSTPMRIGECRQTRRGVTYCRLRIGTRFCPTGEETAEACERAIHISGDMRRGRWRRTRVAAGLRGLHAPEVEV